VEKRREQTGLLFDRGKEKRPQRKRWESEKSQEYLRSTSPRGKRREFSDLLLKEMAGLHLYCLQQRDDLYAVTAGTHPPSFMRFISCLVRI
jgi:hypothetical protein